MIKEEKREQELRSSAVTLSDMEIFVFPELMYALVLANIMSPRVWQWRSDPWFKGISKMRPYRRMQRIRQYIMDNYVFNLDLETWGLTNQEKEIKRFEGIIDTKSIVDSNALFGYAGDAYYFDIDIRTHFGLDKYGSDVIPYWKTETVEAMDAFRYREGYESGAGECVSLAALYAAALFIVGGIPLEKIFLMATPLHSQNFVDVDEGVLVNNRRLVTKSMWFNGSQISGQARRALENERVTVVSHITGWIHLLQTRATIDPAAYSDFSHKLRSYLKSSLTPEILGNFLRQNERCRQCFVLRCKIRGIDRYISLEKLFRFEQDSPYKVTDITRDKLLASVPIETFAASCSTGKVVLNDIEDFVAERSIDLDEPEDLSALREVIGNCCMSAQDMVQQLITFCHTRPRLPQVAHIEFDRSETPLCLDTTMSREDIIQHLESLRSNNQSAELAFYAWRDLSRTAWQPFVKAALERNPVCREATTGLTQSEIVEKLNTWSNESIYDEAERFAQPDEVWTFKRGDGVEKALVVATIMRARGTSTMQLQIEGSQVVLSSDQGEICTFPASKNPVEKQWIL